MVEILRPGVHIDPNDKKPAFRNRIFMEGGASEADISTARAGVHCRTTPLIRIHVRDHKLRELFDQRPDAGGALWWFRAESGAQRYRRKQPVPLSHLS